MPKRAKAVACLGMPETDELIDLQTLAGEELERLEAEGVEVASSLETGLAGQCDRSLFAS